MNGATGVARAAVALILTPRRPSSKSLKDAQVPAEVIAGVTLAALKTVL